MAHISVSTATFYFLPFPLTLEIIARAGFDYIELALPWQKDNWAVAQHLFDVTPAEAARQVRASGLMVSTIHDTGGVLDRADAPLGLVNPLLDEYLAHLDGTPECIVFHTPHVKGQPEPGWWERLSGAAARALEPYRACCTAVTLENMPRFAGYSTPLVEPRDLLEFVTQSDLGLTLDTTHSAELGLDPVETTRLFQPCLRSFHLSDHLDNKRHVYIGEGQLDLPALREAARPADLLSVTLECALSTTTRSDQTMSSEELIARLGEARERVEWLFNKGKDASAQR